MQVRLLAGWNRIGYNDTGLESKSCVNSSRDYSFWKAGGNTGAKAYFGCFGIYSF